MEQINVEKTASRGVVSRPVYLYQFPELSPDTDEINESQTVQELESFSKARAVVQEKLKSLAQGNEIFAAHLEIASDVILMESVEAKILKEKKNAQLALWESIEEFALIFASMEDAYMKERCADIRDVGKRIMAELKKVVLPDLGNIQTEVIVVAKDLYPSDTVKLRPEFVKGIITEEGGVTSHVSIIAKSMGIPILTGVRGLLGKLHSGEVICMDAGNSTIVLKPDEETLAEYETRRERYMQEREHLKKLRDIPAVTKDGKRIALCANAGSIEDVKKALAMNIDGIGLFRSEFLYMNNTHFPTEEEQYQAYKEAAKLSPKELTIRTLDIGGDKELPYFRFEKEDNPFLGWRAIRISLDMKEMFKTQLRAILRASVYGHVRIMFPMIISLEELRSAKKIMKECMEELEAERIPYDREVETGIMVETPASVLLAEEFAKEADFFSIGTNDLVQYLLAVDRGNEKIARKYDYFHPAVIKAIGKVVCAAHKVGIKVGMCGEMAGDPNAVSCLVELGLDEFSMTAENIDYVREQISGCFFLNDEL